MFLARYLAKDMLRRKEFREERVSGPKTINGGSRPEPCSEIGRTLLAFDHKLVGFVPPPSGLGLDAKVQPLTTAGPSLFLSSISSLRSWTRRSRQRFVLYLPTFSEVLSAIGAGNV